MPLQEPPRTFKSYLDVAAFISELLAVSGWEGESEYYPFSAINPRAGFLEIVYPNADTSGRSLRGAAGNGPIFIFLYRVGTWTYLGEMQGVLATAITTDNITKFTVYAHMSAAAGIQREYQLSGENYVCVSEEEITT